jgi:hypothetical protein
MDTFDCELCGERWPDYLRRPFQLGGGCPSCEGSPEDGVVAASLAQPEAQPSEGPLLRSPRPTR